MGRKNKFSSKWSTDATPIGPGRKARKQPAPKLPKQLGKYYIFLCMKRTNNILSSWFGKNGTCTQKYNGSLDKDYMWSVNDFAPFCARVNLVRVPENLTQQYRT